MQQRRLRLGDILDDYCPRERRITNHAVVAMIDDQVKQTRCTTCDADHEYKQARIPRASPQEGHCSCRCNTRPEHEPINQIRKTTIETMDETTSFVEGEPVEAAAGEEQPAEPGAEAVADAAAESRQGDDDGPVHRRLIRATLPRPEGQTPERKIPEFTIRQPGGGRGREFDGNRAGGGGGQRQGQGRRAGGRGPQGSFSGPSRFGGGPRQNSSQGGQRQNGGNRPGPSGGGQRGGGRPQGQSRGPGRKRGR